MLRVTQQGQSRAGTGAKSSPRLFLYHWPHLRPNVCQAPGLWGPWGPQQLWGPGLLLTASVVCFSLLAACYLFNSAREKEGNPVLRDHAHILAYSPTMCPCHLEIQNHDCLKRGKCGLTPHLPGWPLGEMPVPFGWCGKHGWPREPGDGHHMGLASSLGISIPHPAFVLEPSFLTAPLVCVAPSSPCGSSRGRSLSCCTPPCEPPSAANRCLQSGREPSRERCLQSGRTPRGPPIVPRLPWCHQPLVWLRSGSCWLPYAAPGILKSLRFQTILLFPAISELIRNWRQAKEGKQTGHLLSTCSVQYPVFNSDGS